MIHHRPLDRPIERCCVCDEPTGRAGPSDDSLYGDKMDGPYCDKCYKPVSERDEARAQRDALAQAMRDIYRTAPMGGCAYHAARRALAALDRGEES